MKRHLAATALASPSTLSWWPALLLAAPIALPSVTANAATININTGCSLTGNTCLASKIAPGDTVNFKGGVLTMDQTGVTYTNTPLAVSSNSTINQDGQPPTGHANTFSGVFSGTGGLTIVNADPTTGNPLTLGSVTFSGANTYSGATTINSGATLALSGTGSIASGLADTGTFDISNTAAGATIKNLTGTGSVALGSKTLSLANTAPSSFSGNITGAGGVTVSSNSQTLSGTLGYTGATTVNNGATLSFGTGTSASIASLAGSGTVNLASGQTLSITNAADTFSGGIGETTASGNLAITKGTEVLSGANTYTGTTTIGTATQAAILALNGSLKSATTNVSTVTAGANSVLTGVGSTSGNVVNNGTIKPFNTVTSKTGTLTIGGNLTESGATSVLDFVFDTGGTFSKVSVGGTAALAGTLAIETINSFLFPKVTTQYNSLLGSVGATSGDFTNMTYNGSPCTGGNDVWVCKNVTFHNIIGAAGVSIQARRVPEPATLALLGTGLVGLLALRRRRFT